MDDELRQLTEQLAETMGRTNGALAEVSARLTRLANSSTRAGRASDSAADALDGIIDPAQRSAAAVNQFYRALRESMVSMAMTPNTVAKSNQAFGAATLVLDNLQSVGKSLGAAFSSLAANNKTVSGALTKFASKFPGASKVLEVLGKGLGATANAALTVANMQISNTQQVIGMFDNLMSSGATFGVSLDKANQAANDAGLSLETFSQVVSSNAASLALLGGGINSAAKFTTQLARGLAVTNPELVAAYGGIGQLNTAVIDYISLQQRLGVDTVRNQQDIRAGTQFYLRELKELQTVTGKNKEQIAAELQARIKYAANQTALNELTADQRIGLTRDFGKLSPMLQQAAMDILTAQNAGMEAVSETVINLRAASPQMVSLIEQIVANNKNLDPAAAKAANAGLVEQLKIQQDAERQRNKQLFALGAQRPEVLAGTAFETLERTIFEMGPLQAQMSTAVKSAAEASIAISDENKKFVGTYRDINLSLETFKQQMQNLAVTSLPQTVKMINFAYHAGVIQMRMLETGVNAFNGLIEMIPGLNNISRIEMPSFPELSRPNLPQPEAPAAAAAGGSPGTASGPGQSLPAVTPVSMADPNVLRLSSAQLTAQEETNRLLRQIADQTA